MTKILIIINDIKKAQEHEWFVSFIDRTLFEPEFALINCRDTAMSTFLEENGVAVYHYDYSGKKDLPGLIYRLYLLMRNSKYDIVHTHLFNASLAGLMAAFTARVPKRIMTRHYSDYHHVWFPSTVKYDRLMNSLATDIIAISKNVENILTQQESVSDKKIHLIHHGLNMNEYAPGSVGDARVEKIRVKYRIANHNPVVGTISRFTELKGLQFLIPAFKRLLKLYPDSLLVMANAQGDYSKEINDLLEGIPAENQRKISFEEDIAALYKVFDCFVHIPINATAEAFGQTYIEALASKVPSVFTLSGVAPEFIVNKLNALVVDFCDEDEVFEAMLYIVQNNNRLSAMQEKGYMDVNDRFTIQIKIDKLQKLYNGIL